MRRAARAIYALDPGFQPTGMPTQLARIFAIERPAPPPPPRLHARLDGSATLLTGHDADQWSYGLGVAGEAGVLLLDRLVLALGTRYDDHQPLEFVQNGMGLLAFEVLVAWRQPLGPLRLMGGISGGVMHVDIDGALEDASYWGGLLSGVVDLSWPIAAGLGLGVRCAPTLFLTSEDDRLASSNLVPFTVGLRYGR